MTANLADCVKKFVLSEEHIDLLSNPSLPRRLMRPPVVMRSNLGGKRADTLFEGKLPVRLPHLQRPLNATPSEQKKRSETVIRLSLCSQCSYEYQAHTFVRLIATVIKCSRKWMPVVESSRMRQNRNPI